MECKFSVIKGAAPRGLAVVAFIALIGPLASATVAQDILLTELAQPGGGSGCIALAVNRSGEITGSCDTLSGFRAVLWDSDGNLTVLNPLPGDESSGGRDINDSGEVTGFSDDASFGSTAVVWNSGGVPSALLPASPGRNSRGDGINNSGQMVGFSGDNAPPQNTPLQAALWNAPGTPILLPFLLQVNLQSFGRAINDSGKIVGSSNEDPVTWNGNSAPTALQLPGGQFGGTATDVNASGTVAGYVTDTNLQRTAVKWDRFGAVRVLPHLPGEFESQGIGISPTGEVVGSSTTGLHVGDPGLPVHWDANGNITELPILAGDNRGNAREINVRGVIVGVSTFFFNGSDPIETRAVTWQFDGDSDGIGDGFDNCPNTANPSQDNNDGDALGDLCDPDDDNDTVADAADNCVFTPNPGQEDNEGDGLGDVCDPDDDNDTVADAADNCPTIANLGQEDGNGDGFGDACVDPSVDLSDVDVGVNPVIGEGVKIRAGAIIGDNANIGADTELKKDVMVGDNFVAGDQVTIGKNSVIGDDVTLGSKVKVKLNVVVKDRVSIGDETMVHVDTIIKADAVIGASVSIGKNAAIGEGATIGDEATIGDGVVVPDGANVPPGTTVS